MLLALLKNILFRNSIFALCTTATRGAGAVGISFLIANGFSTSEFSDFRFFQLTAVLLTAVAAPGIVSVTTKFFARLHGENERPAPIFHLWVFSFFLAVAVSVLCLAAPVPAIGAHVSQAKLLFAAIVFLWAVNLFPMGAMMGMNRFFQAFLVEVIALFVSVATALYATWSQDILIAVYGMLLAGLAACLLNTLIMLTSVKAGTFQKNRKAYKNRDAAKAIFKTLGPMSITGILITATFWTTGWLIKDGNQNPLYFALYSIGAQWFALANMIPENVGRVVFPKTVQVSSERPEGRRKLLFLSVLVAGGSSTLACAALLVTSPFIMPFYGADYATAPLLLGAYAAAAIPYGIANMIGYAIFANDGEVKIVAIYALQFIVAATAAVLSIGFGGYTGAIALFSGALASMVLSVGIAFRSGLLTRQT